MKPSIAVVRGKFLNRYEMQFFEPLVRDFRVTAFGSLFPYHNRFAFPVVKLPSPMDLPEFPYKMSILNRLFIDAHYLWGLEEKLKGPPAGRQGFDLVHTAETYYRYTQQCLDAKRKGYVRKVIATVLETIPHNNEGIHGRKQYKARARRELDHMIALTAKAKDALVEEGANPGKITVISHFIDTKRFTPGVKKRDPRAVTILFVGRLEEYKGIFDILEALTILRHDPDLSGTAIRAVFVGGGTEQARMTAFEQSHGLGSLVIHEHHAYDDMPDVYRGADIVVAPSKPRVVSRIGKRLTTWEEQYNTSLLEAQASGLAIITTKSGGIPENIGEAGILIAPGDTASLSRELKRLITDRPLRIRLGDLARKRAIRVHDIAIGAGKLTDLYRRILSE
ncbi:glycosyltransferase family 4 protein [Patescibacteria group bacterium]|nr:glycosyltransferase family 4 protein [Patescibacteria group bacterium]